MTYSHNDPTYLGSVARRAKNLQRWLTEDGDDVSHGMNIRVMDLQKQARELGRHVWNGGYKRDTGTPPVFTFAEPFTEAPDLKRIRYP